MNDNPSFTQCDYDSNDDIRKSVTQALNFKKFESDKGGNGIFGFGPSDRYVDDEVMRAWVREFFEVKS